MVPAPKPWAMRAATSIPIEVASPPATSPPANSTSPAVNGTAGPRRSVSTPVTTMPARLERKKPLKTQP